MIIIFIFFISNFNLFIIIIYKLIVGYGIHDTEFECLKKIALILWKNFGHKKQSEKELLAQLRKYFDKAKPYDSSYTVNQDTPYLWWNSIIDGQSSLSRLAKVIFSITPHSASCERLFSAFRWIFRKRRTNLCTETLKFMAKIYHHNLNYSKKSLNHITSNNNDIQQMLDFVYKESDLLNEDDNDQDDRISDESEEELQDINEILDIEKSISLELWIYIDNTKLQNINHNINKSKKEKDWDIENIIN